MGAGPDLGFELLVAFAEAALFQLDEELARVTKLACQCIICKFGRARVQLAKTIATRTDNTSGRPQFLHTEIKVRLGNAEQHRAALGALLQQLCAPKMRQ